MSIDHRPSRFLLCGLVLAAFIHFDPGPPWSVVLRSDEAFSWRLTRCDDLGQLIRMTGEDVHPPLYYILLWCWTRLWGDGEVSLRFLSCMFSWIGVIMLSIYAGMRGASGANVNTIRMNYFAGILVSLSLCQIEIARHARMYAMMMALTVTANMFGLLAIRAPSNWKWWLGFGAAATALLYTHNYGIFFVAAQATWFLFEIYRASIGTRRRLFVSAGLTFLAVGFCYLPWIPWLFWQIKQVQSGFWIRPSGWEELGVMPTQFFAPLLNSLPTFHWTVTAGLFALTLVIFWPWERSSAEYQLVFVMGFHLIAIAATVLLLRPVFVPRYLCHLVPLLAVPVAYWVCRIKDHFLQGLTQSVLIFVMATVLAGVGLTMLGQLKESTREVVKTILENSTESEPVLVAGLPRYLVYRYYITRRRPNQRCLVYDDSLSRADQQHVVFSSAILPEDRWRWTDFRRPFLQRFWLVGRWQPPVPPGWQVVFEATFQESMPFTNKIIVVRALEAPP